jgi:uridine kinase
MLIVGIAGGTGSGKTTVVSKIMEVLISIIEKHLLKSKS